MPSSKLWLQYRRRWTCPLMLPSWLAMLQLMRREVVLVITTSQPDHYRLERPKLQAGCPRADWLGRFFSKVEAANAATDKISHQLLGCLDHDLSALVYNEHAAPETVKLQGCIFYLLGLITFCWLLFFLQVHLWLLYDTNLIWLIWIEGRPCGKQNDCCEWEWHSVRAHTLGYLVNYG